ncbi:MAG: molybdopterin dinucleotide binding domain-containing protein [Caldilineaceae bacterium]
MPIPTNWPAFLPPAHSFLNSTFVNLSRFQQREKEPLLWLHPQDAAARHIASGQPVRVWNALGSVTLTARVNVILRRAVLAPGVWWNKLSGDGRNINQVTPPNETDSRRHFL